MGHCGITGTRARAPAPPKTETQGSSTPGRAIHMQDREKQGGQSLGMTGSCGTTHL